MKRINDLDRLRNEYAAREKRLPESTLYSVFNPSTLFSVQSRQRAELRMLRDHSFNAIDQLRILEIGCGDGGIINDYLHYGARPLHLSGVDLLPERLKRAKKRYPDVNFSCTDAQALPYKDESFHLVLQYTAFTSVLDDRIKGNLSSEMLRVLRKQDGMIIWYDFWLNPKNPHTRGIRKQEIRKLFPGCHFSFHKITLAPPIARKLVPISWPIARMLESLRLFNTHYLVSIIP
ncbi:MAG: class I SAM-dependent methyltransferase [Desulfobacteraceae bacterium]|nr:MAG: class I SAM-dependent methyltransferase [Desulfobacteraceae bacterium]